MSYRSLHRRRHFHSPQITAQNGTILGRLSALVLAWAVGIAAVHAAEVDGDEALAVFIAGKEAIQAGHVKPATVAAERLGRMPGQRHLLVLLECAGLTQAGRRQDAATLLRREYASDDAIVVLPISAQAEVAQTFADAGEVGRALALCDRIGSAHEGLPRAEVSLVTANVMVGEARFEEALTWIDYGRACAVPTYRATAHERAVAAALERKRGQIMDALDCRDHGLGFVLYRKGNQARLAGDAVTALATYDRLLELWKRNCGKPVIPVQGMDDPRAQDLPIHPVYAAAAQVYRAQVLMDGERYDEAARSLAEPGADPGNPYQGEALRALGDLALEARGEVAVAERYYTRAIEALTASQAKVDLLARYGVPAKSIERTRPAADMHARQGWGNTVWFAPKPEQLYNATNCPWYVPYQLMQAQLKRSLCQFLRGDVKAALGDLQIILDVDQVEAAMTRSGMPSNYLRLRDGYRSGGLFATDAEAACFRGERRILFAVADFYIETEQYREAERALMRLDHRFGGRLSQNEAAYLAYARLGIRSLRGDRVQESEVAAYLTRFGQSPSAPRAWMLRASLTKDPERLEIYRQIAKRYANTRYQVEALSRLAQIRLHGNRTVADRTEAIALFQQIRTLVPPGSAYDLASQSFLRQAQQHPGE